MVCPRRAGVPFCLPHKKEPKRVTAEGTGLPWLALRRRRAKLAHRRCAQTVSRFAPDAAPSSRPNPLGGSFKYHSVPCPKSKNVALVESALRNPQLQAVIAHAGEAILIFCKILEGNHVFLAFFASHFRKKSDENLPKRIRIHENYLS